LSVSHQAGVKILSQESAVIRDEERGHQPVNDKAGSWERQAESCTVHARDERPVQFCPNIDRPAAEDVA
jgi:hypothetical protein